MTISRDQATLFAGGLFAGVIVAAVILGLLRQGRPAPIIITPAPPAATATALPSTVTVYVSGEVARPAVYSLPAGGRVEDAIRAAGGFSAGADAEAVNLAMALSDGLHVHVPSPAEAPALPVVSGLQPAGEAGPGAKVNINTATAAELEALPEIGPVTAQAILDHRQENGPFSAVEELLDVPGIGPATLDAVAELVTVN
jgi:competence protein ComEA